ncbi:MAG: hypothetical protein U0821_08765 [Chloroflexota bacterium]
MSLVFERGDPKRPRGHAVVYFRSQGDPSVVMAAYLVVPPITMDFAKYIPPMFAGQLPTNLNVGLSVVPLPPIPEQVESERFVRNLAAARDDDLIDGGTIQQGDIQRLLTVTTDIAAQYGSLYQEYAQHLPEEEPLADSEPAALPGVDVDELLISVMSNPEKVGRLAKLAGTVRYALEGDDRKLLEESLADMGRIGKHLPEHYRVAELSTAVQAPDQARRVDLLVQRCYKLAAEEYTEVQRIEAEIQALGPDAAPATGDGEARPA